MVCRGWALLRQQGLCFAKQIWVHLLLLILECKEALLSLDSIQIRKFRLLAIKWYVQNCRGKLCQIKEMKPFHVSGLPSRQFEPLALSKTWDLLKITSSTWEQRDSIQESHRPSKDLNKVACEWITAPFPEVSHTTNTLSWSVTGCNISCVNYCQEIL